MSAQVVLPMRAPESFSGIVEAFGVARLSRLFDVPLSHIRTMKARDSIPPEYWELLVEEAPSAGITGLTYAKLHRIRAQRFSRSSEVA